MLGFAILAATITAVAGLIVDLAGSFVKRAIQDTDIRPLPSIVASVVTFIVTALLDWWIFYAGTPVFSGAGWAILVLVNLLVVAVVFGVCNYFGTESYNHFDQASGAMWVSVAALIFISVGMIWLWNNWFKGQENVDEVLAHVQVEEVESNDSSKLYPNTDVEHMDVVGEQPARFAAGKVMNNPELGTYYQLGRGELQVVKGHLYYVFDLQLPGWKQHDAMKGVVPGYIMVDAENPSAQAKFVSGLTMKYRPGGTYESSLTRHLYLNGYMSMFQDDPTLEIDESGKPFYTLTVNTPVLRWQDSLPSKFLTVNAQSGKITEYPLDKIPAWVDRVYSRDTARYLLDTWGHWGRAPWEFIENEANRFKVSGHLNLVYTKDGPAWQALLTSFANEAGAVQYIALMDTRSNKVRLYRAPQGLATEESVFNSFDKSPSNLKGNDATTLTLHKIYGQLTWVAAMVGNGEGSQTGADGHPKASSTAGVGVLQATESDSVKVVIGADKGDAFAKYRTQIATGTSNNDPETTAAQKTVSGKVAAVSAPLVFNGSTFIVIRLEGEGDHLYQGRVTETPNSLLMTVTKPGDEVIITYVETGTNNPLRSIASFASKQLAGVK